MKNTGSSPPKPENKETKCPSQCSFKLKPCKKAGTCECICFKIKNCHNHVVDGGDILKWHNVSKETKNIIIAFHKQKLSVLEAQIDYEKEMIADHGEE